tara:strand:- start:32 stop:1081 length:1050 start_codon:yes stop_codon:yes gene_type:complete
MSAVIAIRNAIDMLQVSDLEHIAPLREAFLQRETVLKTEHKNAEKLRKQSDAKRLTLLKKIQKIEPSFNYDRQSDPDLQTYLTEIKNKAAEDAKYQKKHDTLIKKFTDKFPTEECPNDMTNDDLDAHIKSKLDAQKKYKADKKKQDAKALRDANLVSKLSQEITTLPIPQGASVEDLKALIKQQKTIAQEQKREQTNCDKFRKLHDAIRQQYPDADISPISLDATSQELELALQDARQKRDNKKIFDKEQEKKRKAQERADKKADDIRNKLDQKTLKAENKLNGIKGTQKNAPFQRFCSYIKLQLDNGHIDQTDIDDAGGKAKYNSKRWRELNSEQKNNPKSPWNIPSH